MRQAALLVVALSSTSKAGATTLGERLSLHGEAGVGSMVFDEHPEPLAFGLALQAAARLGVRVVPAVSLELSLMSSYFPSDEGSSSQMSYCAGLRIQPALAGMSVFLNANVGLGTTADVARPTADAALGLELAVGSAIGLGPFIRYARLFAARGDEPGDAQFVTAGLSVRFDPSSERRVGRPSGTLAARRSSGGASFARSRRNDSADRDASGRELSAEGALVSVEPGWVRTAEPIAFSSGHGIAPAAEPILEAVASTLLARPEIRRLSIECRSTDSPRRAARALCERRAAQVMLWLIEHGVAASRVEARGFIVEAPPQPGQPSTRVDLRILDEASE